MFAGMRGWVWGGGGRQASSGVRVWCRRLLGFWGRATDRSGAKLELVGVGANAQPRKRSGGRELRGALVWISAGAGRGIAKGTSGGKPRVCATGVGETQPSAKENVFGPVGCCCDGAAADQPAAVTLSDQSNANVPECASRQETGSPFYSHCIQHMALSHLPRPCHAPAGSVRVIWRGASNSQNPARHARPAEELRFESWGRRPYLASAS